MKSAQHYRNCFTWCSCLLALLSSQVMKALTTLQLLCSDIDEMPYGAWRYFYCSNGEGGERLTAFV